MRVLSGWRAGETSYHGLPESEAHVKVLIGEVQVFRRQATKAVLGARDLGVSGVYVAYWGSYMRRSRVRLYVLSRPHGHT